MIFFVIYFSGILELYKRSTIITQARNLRYKISVVCAARIIVFYIR
jgi:hypothetical protein